MTNKLMLCWQDPVSRQWLVVGTLSYDNQHYQFRYAKKHFNSLKKYGFPFFGSMSDLDKVYKSEQLFPSFKNRLLTKSRPEYQDYLGWLGLSENETSDMEELARSGGVRMTDNLQLIPYPKKEQGLYRVKFFAHGLMYIQTQKNGRLKDLKTGSKLYLMRDMQNEVNPLALALRTDDPLAVVGYCPDFLVNDFNKLLDRADAKSISVSVVKVNLDAPLQFLLYCEFRSRWVDGFTPFGYDENPVLTQEIAV